MKKYAIIIPSLNPTESLVHYVQSLLEKGVAQIVVVNDGSQLECNDIFSKIKKMDRCTVLKHELNLGKGRALKTAFQYVLENHSDLAGVITADADGQHSVEDVYKVAKTLENSDEQIVLGVRDFRQANVPFRSYIGNRITSGIFEFLFHHKLGDTQTGLRGIPQEILKQLVELKGERYEYEMNMLIYATKIKMKITEVPIQTLYFDHNKGSHYKSIVDSFKVLSRLISGFLQYSFGKAISFVIGIISFVFILISLAYLWE
ncbi:glycosyltransferase family 2 protein [Tepidibacillus infernus]|uniref:glycosyltransferase family 2 protein n=1 Tax=Tepidibacillus infernus TaxID=1806172 RepID=UPI003B752863